MRVGLDVTAVTTGGTGVARYVRQLTAALGREDVQLALLAFGRGRRPAPDGTRQLRIPLRILHAGWGAVAWPSVERLVGPVDLVHAPDLRPPPTRAPVVMTVHDLAAVDLPALHSPRRVAAQRAQLDAARSAAIVFAVSRATADRLVAHGVDGDRIVVTPLGHTPLPPPGPRTVAPPFVLAVGEIAPRKNLPLLVRAFRAAALSQDMRLVIAGPHGQDTEAVLAAADDRVVLLGPVDDATLARLYGDATALCFPSRAEGFGLPVLEAMAAGLPVVASDLEVLREVAGPAAVLVDSLDENGWIDALRTVTDDEQLRRRLIADGRRRAAEFTWTATAEATLTGYRKAAGCG